MGLNLIVEYSLQNAPAKEGTVVGGNSVRCRQRRLHARHLHHHLPRPALDDSISLFEMKIVLFDVVKDPRGPAEKIRKKSRLLCAETVEKLCAMVNVQNITTSANADQITPAFYDLVALNQVLDDNANFNQHGTLSVVELVNIEEENFAGRELPVQMEKKLPMDIFQSKENEDFNQMTVDLNQLQVSANKNSGTSQAETTICETDGKVKILEEKTNAEREELLEMKVPNETDKIEVVMDSNIIEPLAVQNHKQQGENGITLVY